MVLRMRDADHGAYGVEGREELICAYHFGGMGVKSAGWGGWFTAYVRVPRERECVCVRERERVGEHKSAGNPVSCFCHLVDFVM